MNKKQSVLIVVLIMASALAGALGLRGIAMAQSSRAQQQPVPAASAGMQKWEYILMSGTPSDVDKQLREAGATSWEVVGLTATEVEGSKQRVIVILRHPKP